MTFQYIYTLENRLKNPHKYMYSEFKGKNLIIKYRENRLKIISNLNLFSSKSLTNNQLLMLSYIDRITENNKFDIDSIEEMNQIVLFELINKLIKCLKYKLDKKTEILIFKIIQRFEVSKIFFEKYDKNLRKGINKDFSPKTYLHFSFCLCLANSYKRNNQFLSTLLKLNDLLISLEIDYMNTNYFYEIFELVLRYELNSIDKLLIDNGIKI